MKITDEMLFKSASEAEDFWLHTLPDAKVIPEHKFSPKFERKMKKLIRKSKRSKQIDFILKSSKKVAIFCIIVISLTFFICQRAFYTFSGHGIATIGDYFIFCMAGIEPFQFGMGEQFRFPIQWIILLGGMLYTSLNYPRQDIGTYGQQMLIRMDSRMTWWLSKWTWLFLNSLILFLTYIVTIILFSICKGVPFALASSPDMTDLLYINYWDYISISLSGNKVKLISIMLPFLVLFSLSTLQLLFTLIISPMFSSISIIAHCHIYNVPIEVKLSDSARSLC